MMQVTYRLKLGQDEFELRAEVKDEKDFFETMSFYSNLPKTAPGGSTDLKLVFRATKKGHKYYSLISETEKKEFKLGQNLDANGGGLFCKGWEDLFGAEQEEDQEQSGSTQQASAPIINPAPAKAAAPKTVAPKVTPAPAAPIAAPVQASTPSVAPATATPAASITARFAAPKPAATPTVAPAVSNPQVSAVASNVLSRFGINK